MAAKGEFTVCVFENPTDQLDHKTIEVPFNRQRIAEIQRKYAGEDALVWLNARQITQEEADCTRVKIGDAIGLSVHVGDPVSVGMMLLSMAVSYVIGQIMPQPDEPPPSLFDQSASGWHPKTKQQAGLPIPYCYGTNRLYGNIISAKTEVDDDGDENANFTVAWGGGPMQGPVADTLLIDNQPIENFTAITAESRNGTLNQTACTSVTANSVEYSLQGREVFETGTTYTTPDDDFEDLEIVLECPYGLAVFPGRGYNGFIDIKIEVSVHDADSWTTLVYTYLTSGSRARFVKHYLASETYPNGTPIPITRGNQYDIRITKSDHVWYRWGNGPGIPGWQWNAMHDPGVDVAAYNALWDIGGHTSMGPFLTFQAAPSKMNIFSITEIFATQSSNNLQTFPGVAYSAVSTLWTGQFSGSISVSEVWQGRIVQVYDGIEWKLEYSANPAWVLWDLLTLPVISGDGITWDYAVERYYGVQAAAQLSFWESFYEAAQYWDEDLDNGRGGTEKFTFSGTFDRETTVWDAIQKVCEVCSCNLVYQGTGYRLVVDKAESYCQVFTDDNTVDGTLEQKSYNVNVASELNGYFYDAESDYEKTAILATNQTIGTSISTTMDLIGITSEGNAARVLNRRLLHNQYVKSHITFEAGRDALNLIEGSVILVQNRSLESSDSVSAMVFSVPSTSTIELDRDIEDTSKITNCVIRTAASGTDNISYYTVTDITGRIMTISGTFNVAPLRGDIIALGPEIDLSRQWRVTAIERMEKFNHIISADEYHAAIYGFDSAQPTVAIASHSVARRPIPLNSLMTQGTMVNSMPGSALAMDPMDVPILSNTTWTGNGSTTVSWASSDSVKAIRVYYRGSEYMIEPDETTSAYVYWDRDDPNVFTAATSRAGIDPTDGEFLLAGNESGTCKLYMGTGVVENLGVLAELDTVDTDEIEDEAVNYGAQSYSASGYSTNIGTSWTTVQTATVYVTTGFGEFVEIGWSVNFDEYSGNAVAMNVRIIRGSTPITEFPDIAVPASLYKQGAGYCLDPVLTTGNQSYHLQVKKPSSTGTITADQRAVGAKLWKGK